MSRLLEVEVHTDRPGSMQFKREFSSTEKASQHRHWVEINVHLIIKNWLVFLCVCAVWAPTGQQGGHSEVYQLVFKTHRDAFGQQALMTDSSGMRQASADLTQSTFVFTCGLLH